MDTPIEKFLEQMEVRLQRHIYDQCLAALTSLLIEQKLDTIQRAIRISELAINVTIGSVSNGLHHCNAELEKSLKAAVSKIVDDRITGLTLDIETILGGSVKGLGAEKSGSEIFHRQPQPESIPPMGQEEQSAIGGRVAELERSVAGLKESVRENGGLIQRLRERIRILEAWSKVERRSVIDDILDQEQP